MKYAVEVGGARPAQGNKPSAGPIYRYHKSKDAFPTLEGISTLVSRAARPAIAFRGSCNRRIVRPLRALAARFLACRA